MHSDWQPQWTTQVRIESGGRYPLGLNRFHNGLEEILIKSITVTANRLRYITYCCWAIGDIEQLENCQQYAEFVESFRRRENSLALGLYQRKPEYSFYGSTSISKSIKKGGKEYDCSFDLMESNKLGAFGLYYAGTIYNLGLTETNEKGIIVLTELGKELHAIAERYYSKAKPKYYKSFRGKRKVPSQILLEWGKVNDFDNIRNPECKEEREFYKALIFRLGKTKVADYRRDTFAFFMHCIDKCSKTGGTFNEDVLRNVHYYSSYHIGSKVCSFSVPNHFNDVHFYWFIYEGHVYFRWWLELYFDAFLTYLKSCDNGATLDEFFSQFEIGEFNSTIADFCNKRKDYFNNTLKTILALFPRPSNLADASSEETITFDKDHTTSASVLAQFLLISVNLYRKYKAFRSDKRYQYLVMKLEADLWFDVLFHFTNLEEMSVRDFLRIVLKRHILEQHDLIMMEKHDLRRCWFTIENKRYIFETDVIPTWRPAKYGTIINFLSDMKLLNVSKEEPTLSQDGTLFFKKLIQDYY